MWIRIKDIDYDVVREKIIGGVHAYFKHFLGGRSC